MSTPNTESDAGSDRPETSVRALVSIHDLMPATMPGVRKTLNLLERLRVPPVTLLVVPGSGWDRTGIAELRALQRDGHRLAGHGWSHRAERFGGLYHRLHGLFLSRRVAEHLALDQDGIVALMRRCHAWFGDQGLDAPSLYVPPAWALGSVPADRLAADCPFERIEVFSGLLHPNPEQGRSRLEATAMLGYEADEAVRVPVIKAWNALNRWRAERLGILRIGIHSQDTDLRVADDLTRDLLDFRRYCDYDLRGAR